MRCRDSPVQVTHATPTPFGTRHQVTARCQSSRPLLLSAPPTRATPTVLDRFDTCLAFEEGRPLCGRPLAPARPLVVT